MGERKFPIMMPKRIYLPWSLFAPHEERAKANHSQSLETLASRGGLAPDEAVRVLENRPWKFEKVDDTEALLALIAHATKDGEGE